MDRETQAQEDSLVRTAELGIEAEKFLHSRLGKELLMRADEERANILTQLIDADPEDPRAQRKWRLELAKIDKTLEWINEFINSGRAAHESLKLQEAEQTGF